MQFVKLTLRHDRSKKNAKKTKNILRYARTLNPQVIQTFHMFSSSKTFLVSEHQNFSKFHDSQYMSHMTQSLLT